MESAKNDGIIFRTRMLTVSAGPVHLLHLLLLGILGGWPLRASALVMWATTVETERLGFAGLLGGVRGPWFWAQPLPAAGTVIDWCMRYFATAPTSDEVTSGVKTSRRVV